LFKILTDKVSDSLALPVNIVKLFVTRHFTNVWKHIKPLG